MLNCLAKLLLTCTSLLPIGFMYAFVLFYKEHYKWGIFLILFCTILFLLFEWIMEFIGKWISGEEFTINSSESVDEKNIEFLLLYLLPLFTFTGNFDELHWFIFIPAIIFLAVVIGTGNNYHCNPLLRLIGWHFYKVGTPEGVTYMLITKQSIRDARSKVFNTKRISEYVMIEIDKEK